MRNKIVITELSPHYEHRALASSKQDEKTASSQAESFEARID
jgi:hypothetical protein